MKNDTIYNINIYTHTNESAKTVYSKASTVFLKSSYDLHNDHNEYAHSRARLWPIMAAPRVSIFIIVEGATRV